MEDFNERVLYIIALCFQVKRYKISLFWTRAINEVKNIMLSAAVQSIHTKNYRGQKFGTFCSEKRTVF